MSKRPVEAKKRRRVAKQLRRTPLPAYFDLVQWMLDHGHARTRRAAREMILARRVKSDSHPLGVVKALVEKDGIVVAQDIVDPRVPIARRANIIVSNV
jgi:hypothetical protein